MSFVASVVLGFGIAVAGTSAANASITNLVIGNTPRGVAVNSVTNRIYVTKVSNNTVAVIDGATNTVVTNIPVGSSPVDVAVNDVTNRVYVANQASNDVSVIDAVTNTVIATIPVATGPSGIAVSGVTNRVYVSNGSSGSVSVIDGATNLVVATVPVGAGPQGVGVNTFTNRIYVANSLSDTVSVIDGVNNTVVNSIPLAPNGPMGVAVNQLDDRIYTSDFNTGAVTVIDGATNTVLTTIATGAPPAVNVAFNPSTHRLFVTLSGGSVGVIDTDTNAIVATATIGGSPADIGVNTITNSTYVSDAVETVAVIALPVVTGVTPTSSTSCGARVTITGSGFTGFPPPTGVTFGGVPGTGMSVVNDTTLTVTTPTHAAGVVDVAVQTALGNVTIKSAYTFTPLTLILGSSVLRPGERQNAIASGFTPGETVTGTMSPSLALGQHVADSQGVVTFSWVVPTNTPLGEHNVVLHGTCSDSVSAAFRVTAGVLAETGVGGGPLLGVGLLPALFGLSLIAVRRVRMRGLAMSAD